MQGIESVTTEEQIEDLPEDATVLKVHSVSRPINDGLESAHDSWSILMYENGEMTGKAEEEIAHDDFKEPIKQSAREEAKERAPAVILF